jgi:hypothetical protein
MHSVASERYVRLQFEQLLAKPRAELQRVCAQLALSDTDMAVTEMLQPGASPFACLGPVGANLGDDPDFLRDPVFPPPSVTAAPSPHLLRSEVATMAGEFGYD